MNHELWRAIASGALAALLNKLVEIADIDARRVLNERLDPVGWLRVQLSVPTSMGFVLDLGISKQIFGLIQSPNYKPSLAPQDPPHVQNATVTGGTTISADDPGAEYVTMVYSFDGVEFELVGPLADNSTPLTGNYVLVNHSIEDEQIGLPTSQFLTIS